jgi:GMP synthase-like glutamine amidotransferase
MPRAGAGAAERTGTPTALCVHHDPDSSLGLLDSVLVERGFAVRSHSVGTSLTDPTGSPEFPDLGVGTGAGPDVLVAMGSRWSVTDARTAHWVEPELEMLRRADRAGIPVLGVCFGAQLLAAAHGGRVEASPEPEIGWLDVRPEPPRDDAGPVASGALVRAITAGPWFEWHGDRFQPPPGAEVLARTDICVQAFTLRRNLAVQFHPEVDPETLDLWLRHDRGHLEDLGTDVDRLVERTHSERDRAATDVAALFDVWWSSIS